MIVLSVAVATRDSDREITEINWVDRDESPHRGGNRTGSGHFPSTTTGLIWADLEGDFEKGHRTAGRGRKEDECLLFGQGVRDFKKSIRRSGSFDHGCKAPQDDAVYNDGTKTTTKDNNKDTTKDSIRRWDHKPP